MKSLAVAIVLFAASCGPGSPGGPTMGNRMGGGGDATPQSSSVASADILSREPISNTAVVKHILISWKDLEDNFNGHQDERAQKRNKAQAEAEVKALMDQIKGGADFETLMKASSEDLGSANSNRPFTVTPDAQLVIEFRQLSLRLDVGEVGVVQSDFGFHIIKRYPN